MGAQFHILSKRFAKATGGSTMPIFAISLMAILSLVGATIALGMDSRSGHALQQAADASALGGATAFLNTDSPKAEVRLAAARVQASALARQNSDYELADMDIGAVSEDAYGQHTRIEVELEFKPVNYFAKIAGGSATAPVRRRAVASATWGFPLCVLTLDENNPGIRIRDYGRLSAKGCIVWSNSSAGEAMKFDGGSADAKAFCAHGGYRRDAKASVSPLPETGCQQLPDPLKGYSIPLSGICDSTNANIKRIGSTRLQPGIYCGGLIIHARNVTMDPGIYHIRGGGLKIIARGALEAQGVTFILDNEVGNIDIKGNSGLNVVAPSTGPTAGMAFVELKGPFKHTKNFKIDGQVNVEGVVYMPSYDVSVRKFGGGTTKSPYLQVVANSVEISGRGSLDIDFDMSATDLPMVIAPEKQARLLE
ncbi:TadE/TadG family type IV pilus assembly protein [Henriciella litoralis]|uniref:TadE/TadG family type IV pilus assembly protein n=1 Tax=Henriciella litoralis TaxID=568102 RepID=UPI0009FBD24E|nr:pilus assembly protein TadG-related protein [Henriciella litoralis]